MRLTIRWRTIALVVRDGWPMWLPVLGVILAFWAAWRFSNTLTEAVRYTGTTLQIFGLTTVALGLGQMRRKFGRPSRGKEILSWLRRLADVFTRPKVHSAEASAGGSSMARADAALVRGHKPGATLDERVSELEENLNLLESKIDSGLEGVRREISTVKESVDRESQESRTAIKNLAGKIEEVAIGGLNLEVVGLIWLFLGVIAGTIPDLIAGWLLQADCADIAR